MKNKLNPFVLLDTNLNLSYRFGKIFHGKASKTSIATQ